MNIYSYFQRVERNIQGVPSKHTGLYNDTINQTKLANLSKTSSYEIISWASDLLQDDNNEFTGFKEEMKKRVNEKKEHFWFREFLDFPLYLFIYITCLNVLYDMIGNGFQSFMVLITPGFLIQIIGVYVSIKLLLLFLIKQPDRSTLVFWLGLAFLFFIYMLSNYALRSFDMVIFTMPLWLWLIVQIVLLVGSYYYIKKEDLI